MAIVTGTAAGDILAGTATKDVIDGGLGADAMTGGLGHDTYYIDNAGDTVTENAGEGTDTLYASISYTLSANAENLILIGGNLNAIGNQWDNTIIGTAGNNIIVGAAGADTMNGGAGNDTYYIDIFSENGINTNLICNDVIIDKSGTDTVAALGTLVGGGSFTYIMQKTLENCSFLVDDGAGGGVDFTVTGNKIGNNMITGLGDDTVSGDKGNDTISTDAGDDTLNGNDGNDTLTAGDGDDIIDGGKGIDSMTGGLGDDTYYLDKSTDVVTELPGAGTDTLCVAFSYTLANGSPLENVTLTGTKGMTATGNNVANTIIGNTGSNILHGGDGDDEIHGGGGRDNIYGDGGADTFYFDAETGLTGSVNIHDFSVAQGDIIDVADLLSGYSGGAVISGFVHVVDKGANTAVYVDQSGDGLAANFVLVAMLLGVNGLTGEQALLNNGNLIGSH